ncbi:MAG: proteasome subunit beta [Candidatus Woesearchaeota archaeon]
MTPDDVLKTGTTTVGMVCKDAIILAADKRATAGDLIVDKKTEKIKPITDNMALTVAGTVSDIQLLVKLIKAEIKLKDIRTARATTVVEAANLLAGMVYSNIRKISMIPGISHFLLAGYDLKTYLFDIFPDGSISEVEDFVSSGSGSVFAYGVLEANYSKNLAEEDGVKLAVKAVNAALQRDSVSGDGIDVFVINKNGVKKVFQKAVNSRIE